MIAVFGKEAQGGCPTLAGYEAARREILLRHGAFGHIHQLHKEVCGRCASEGTLAKGSHAGKVIGAVQSRADRVRQVRDGWDLHVCDLGKDM